jgi:hypothetical protein
VAIKSAPQALYKILRIIFRQLLKENRKSLIMKHSSFLLCLLFLTAGSSVFSKNIDGAWEFKDAQKHIVLLCKDGYFTHTEFGPKEFMPSWGGVAKTNDNQITVSVEFHSGNSGEVGKEIVYNYSVSEDELQLIENGMSKKYKRIDNGNAPLAGVWKINAREQNGKMETIHQSGARKTLKMLTGNRFQWFAINPETKQFSGTGGGTYTFSDGKYTENIQFFSRDNNRAGAQLTFDGKIENSEWHHSGLSSKGDKIYEIWRRIN